MPPTSKHPAPSMEGSESPALQDGTNAQSMTEEEEEEDDYMSMTILEPEKPKWQKETYSEMRRRKERESYQKSHQKSKAELAAEEAARRDEGLSTDITSTTSKGFAMMAKLGFKHGDTLGVTGGRAEPLSLSVKEDRGGIGHESERKRKFREETKAAAEEAERKKVKQEAEGVGFRERVAVEREERRAEGLWRGAMGVAEGLDDDEEEEWTGPTEAELRDRDAEKKRQKPNVLWRLLSRERADREQDRIAKRNLTSRLPTLADLGNEQDEEDEYDRIALSREEADDGVDEELDEYLELPIKERLEKVVTFLRETWNYCFWCKFRYPDAEMEGCPGLTEEDHD